MAKRRRKSKKSLGALPVVGPLFKKKNRMWLYGALAVGAYYWYSKQPSSVAGLGAFPAMMLPPQWGGGSIPLQFPMAWSRASAASR